MSARLLALAADLERFDALHEARLLVLLGMVAGKGPVDGIMKLAKMDFLVRYPKVLDRALVHAAIRKPTALKVAGRISDVAKNTVEGKMIRFRYGPWDTRYRRWLAIMTAKGLVTVTKRGRTVQVALTDRGQALSKEISRREDFKDLAVRADAVRFAVGNLSATRLKELVYEITPELLGMKWGTQINI